MPGIDPITSLGGLGLGLVGGIVNLFGAGKANRRLKALMAADPTYSANPIAAQRMALAQNLLNARMPGAVAAERNIMSGTAGQVANINRNATDASQALALSSSAYGQQGREFQQLQQAEAQDYQRRYANLTEAQQGEIAEQQKAFEDQVRRFNDRAAIEGAMTQNRANAWSSLGNLGIASLNLGLAGGFGNMNWDVFKSKSRRLDDLQQNWKDGDLKPSTYKAPLQWQ